MTTNTTPEAEGALERQLKFVGTKGNPGLSTYIYIGDEMYCSDDLPQSVRDEIIAAWNTRATPPPTTTEPGTPSEFDRLKSMKDKLTESQARALVAQITGTSRGTVSVDEVFFEGVGSIEQINALFVVARQLERDLHAANHELAEARAEGERLREANAVLQSQVDNNDVNFEQLRMSLKGQWRTKIEAAEKQITELENGTELTSLRASRDEAVKALEEARAELKAMTAERDELQAKLEVESASETCVECNQQWNPSLIESGSCIFCIQNETKSHLTTATARLAEAERDAKRLDTLEQMLANMPDLAITLNDDDCSEDSIGIVPKGWNIRCDSVCVEPLTINAPTLRAAIDQATAAAREG